MTLLPNFLYIGTSKAGSTWIYRMLDEHPEIHTAPGKGLYFFRGYYDRGWDWYRKQFAPAHQQRMIGEVSPISRGCLVRISTLTTTKQAHAGRRAACETYGVSGKSGIQSRKTPRTEKDGRTGKNVNGDPQPAIPPIHSGNAAQDAPETRQRLHEIFTPEVRQMDHLLGTNFGQAWQYPEVAASCSF